MSLKGRIAEATKWMNERGWSGESNLMDICCDEGARATTSVQATGVVKQYIWRGGIDWGSAVLSGGGRGEAPCPRLVVQRVGAA